MQKSENNTLAEIFVARLAHNMEMTGELAEHFSEVSYRACAYSGDEDSELSKQFWCIIGARNSYSKAIKEGSWQGFDCPIKRTEARIKSTTLAQLLRSKDTVLNTVYACANNAEQFLAAAPQILRILEHEISHHGHIIRYAKALNIDFPSDFSQHYQIT